MRCRDLAGTWDELRAWLQAADVLVLPRLTGVDPGVRLDCDLPAERPATPGEVAIATGRLRAIVERFEVPAVYVGQVRAESSGELASVTVRVMAGGILHELTLAAAPRPGLGVEFEHGPLAAAGLS
jgi:hypothetical protein